jgi:hypothetical protein
MLMKKSLSVFQGLLLSNKVQWPAPVNTVLKLLGSLKIREIPWSPKWLQVSE